MNNKVLWLQLRIWQWGRVRQAHSQRSDTSDTLRSNVRFGISVNKKKNNKRGCSNLQNMHGLYAVSLTRHEFLHDVPFTTQLTPCADTPPNISHGGVQRALALAEAEKDVWLLHMGGSHTPCIYSSAKAGKCIAVSNVNFLFSGQTVQCHIVIKALASKRCAVYVHIWQIKFEF